MYTEVTPKVSLGLRGLPPSLSPPASLNLNKLSRFGAANAGSNPGRHPWFKPTFGVTSVYWFIFSLLILFMPKGVFSEHDLRSTYPFLSGNTFRAFCDHILDEYTWGLDPDRVNSGDKIFVKTEYLHVFFLAFHPRINNPYILVTHNSDLPIPGKYEEYLDSPKLLAWFGQNVERVTHQKLFPVPIGLNNRRWWEWAGSTETLQRVQKETQAITKKNLVYLNFNIKTYPVERAYVFSLFSHVSFCKRSKSVLWEKYLHDVAESSFVLSPRGNGLDCHRTWEAMYMGSIPILITSASDSMYKDLPVLIINDWKEVTSEFLETKLKEMEGREYHFDKLYADYWFELIDSFKERER